MPWRPARPCRYPGCGRLSPNGICPAHVAAEKAQRAAYDRARGTPSARGYDHAWRKLRARILARDPVCTICGDAPSTNVDHRVAKAQGGTDADENLRGACHRCHSRKTAREDTPGWRR